MAKNQVVLGTRSADAANARDRKKQLDKTLLWFGVAWTTLFVTCVVSINISYGWGTAINGFVPCMFLVLALAVTKHCLSWLSWDDLKQDLSYSVIMCVPWFLTIMFGVAWIVQAT